MSEVAYRSIRSFVTRPRRLTAGQARALEDHWPRYGIDFSETPLILESTFSRVAPKILDIGSGMGEVSIALAMAHPENDYLATEVHEPGVGRLIRQAAAKQLDNIRVIQHDIVDVLKYQLMDNSLDQILIFFPDPWPKKRHHKRRLLQAEFLELLKPKIKAHGLLFLATDWQELAEHMLDTCDQDNGLVNLAGRGHYTPRPTWRIVSKFENRGRNLEHDVWNLAYARKNS